MGRQAAGGGRARCRGSTQKSRIGALLPTLRSDEGPLPPPDNNDQRGRANATEQCSWGPALAFVGVDFSGDICPSWTHQAGVVTPANLHASQLERRLGQAAPAPAE